MANVCAITSCLLEIDSKKLHRKYFSVLIGMLAIVSPTETDKI